MIFMFIIKHFAVRMNLLLNLYKCAEIWNDNIYSLFRKSLQIAKQLGDRALEAQACYSLGNTYTLIRDFETSIKYHQRHLLIAQELFDRVGEGRACWSLGNANSALGNHKTALTFANRHLEISKEVSGLFIFVPMIVSFFFSENFFFSW